MSFKKVAILSSGSIINTVICGLFGIYVTRTLGPQNKGILTIVLSSCDLMSMLFSFGVPYSAAYYVRVYPGSEAALESFTNRTMIVCGLLSLSLLLMSEKLFSSIFLGGWEIDPVMGGLLIATVIVNSGNSIIGAAVIAQGDSSGYVRSTNAGSVVTVLSTALLLVTASQKLHGVVLGSLIGNLAATFLMRKRFRGRCHRGDEVHVPAGEILRYGLNAQWGGLGTLVFKRLDLYIISHFLNPAAVGFYSVGVGLRDLAMTASRAVGGLSGGDMADPAKQADGTAQLAFRKGVGFNVVSSALITLVALPVFPYLIPLAYGPSFAASVYPSMIIMGSLLPLSVALLVGKAVHARGKPLYLSVSSVVSAALSSVIIWQLARQYGSVGAAVSTIINSVILLGSGWVALLLCGWYQAVAPSDAGAVEKESL